MDVRREVLVYLIFSRDPFHYTLFVQTASQYDHRSCCSLWSLQGYEQHHLISRLVDSPLLAFDEQKTKVKRAGEVSKEVIDTYKARSVDVSNLPDGVTIETVTEFFASQGKVLSVRLLMRQGSKSALGNFCLTLNRVCPCCQGWVWNGGRGQEAHRNERAGFHLWRKTCHQNVCNGRLALLTFSAVKEKAEGKTENTEQEPKKKGKQHKKEEPAKLTYVPGTILVITNLVTEGAHVNRQELRVGALPLLTQYFRNTCLSLEKYSLLIPTVKKKERFWLDLRSPKEFKRPLKKSKPRLPSSVKLFLKARACLVSSRLY